MATNNFDSVYYLYDKVQGYIPKGRLKDVKAYADEHDWSVSALINRLLREELGMSREQWKNPDNQ